MIKIEPGLKSINTQIDPLIKEFKNSKNETELFSTLSKIENLRTRILSAPVLQGEERLQKTMLEKTIISDGEIASTLGRLPPLAIPMAKPPLSDLAQLNLAINPLLTKLRKSKNKQERERLMEQIEELRIKILNTKPLKNEVGLKIEMLGKTAINPPAILKTPAEAIKNNLVRLEERLATLAKKPLSQENINGVVAEARSIFAVMSDEIVRLMNQLFSGVENMKFIQQGFILNNQAISHFTNLAQKVHQSGFKLTLSRG